MSIHRKLMTDCAVAVLTFGLAACGGGSDNSARDSLQEELDALHAAYGGDGPLTPAAITQLQTDLGAATDRIGSADDPMSLLGMLAAAADEVTGLQTEVTDLMTTLGDADNPDPASTRGMLAAKIVELTAAMARIGSTEDGTGLLGDLATEQAKVAQLTEDLATANARITALVAGTDDEQLTPIQTAAMAASVAAAAAETTAGAAADAAKAAMANRATMQTGEANSVADAYAATAAAKTAMDEAAKALAAYNAATMAPNAMIAAAERDKAVDAKDAAEAAQTAAETAQADAEEDAAAELKIDGTVKSVGTAMVDLSAGEHSETINDVKKNTGKVADIMDTSAVVDGVWLRRRTR